MPILRNKDMSKMSNAERDSKIKDLKMELVKEQVNLAKGGKTKVREMKKTIARLLTFNRLNETVENK
ncbi:50S ribosomal protein L29 [Candidatus Pacearchaeota archaeon]|nr:50S ribosomal protein L29 [Candidatus Pacearchaeota archaeon]|tara:strand:+ start:279 stop:479 length:201 start_codon:yes stop_codon:yes gene_type:complete